MIVFESDTVRTLHEASAQFSADEFGTILNRALELAGNEGDLVDPRSGPTAYWPSQKIGKWHAVAAIHEAFARRVNGTPGVASNNVEKAEDAVTRHELGEAERLVAARKSTSQLRDTITTELRACGSDVLTYLRMRAKEAASRVMQDLK